jgi:hypothetical protein
LREIIPIVSFREKNRFYRLSQRWNVAFSERAIGKIAAEHFPAGKHCNKFSGVLRDLDNFDQFQAGE